MKPSEILGVDAGPEEREIADVPVVLAPAIGGRHLAARLRGAQHLRRLVAIATVEGAKVSILTRIGRLSQDPDTVLVLCDNVKGLGTTLDPSHYICGPHAGRGYDQILKYVYHVELRDSTKDELQVRVGQGELEYSRLVNQLRRVGYNRAMAVNMTPIEGTDHNSEMRKFRLLLESLL